MDQPRPFVSLEKQDEPLVTAGNAVVRSGNIAWFVISTVGPGVL
jgi:hypothetical protein